MRFTSSFFLSLALPTLMLFSCSEEEPSRPPTLGGASIGAGSASGRSAQGGSAGAEAEQETTLDHGEEEPDPEDVPASGQVVWAGTVRTYDSDSFEATTSYDEAFLLRVLDSEGIEVADAQGSEGSEGAFSFESEFESDEVWLVVEPDDERFLATVTPRSEAANSLSLPLLSQSILGEVLATTAMAPAIIDGAGHLLLRIVDSEGKRLSGVSVYVEAGNDFTYASGSTWSEFRDNTDATGLLLAYNMLASSYPGDMRELRLTGRIDQEVSVRIIAGMVTLVTVTAEETP